MWKAYLEWVHNWTEKLVDYIFPTTAATQNDIIDKKKLQLLKFAVQIKCSLKERHQRQCSPAEQLGSTGFDSHRKLG